MQTIRDEARAYVEKCFAIARIKPGDKRPKNSGWTRRSCSPDVFQPGDNIGLLTGGLSGNLVCVDIDSARALALADQFLPPTGMVEGRAGKPRSHRWYVVTDIPPDLQAERTTGCGHGPRTRVFRGADKKVQVEFLGTGRQAVCPPSVWRQDGREEVRQWEGGRMGSPAVVDCRTLFEAVCRLAAACGWAKKSPARQRKKAGRAKKVIPAQDFSTSEAARRARLFLSSFEPAVEGQGGDFRTYLAARVLVIDFALREEEALPILLEYNRRCLPPWSEEELLHKLRTAARGKGQRGGRVRAYSTPVVVSLRPGDTSVYVGEDCAGAYSYVSLPTLRAGAPKSPAGRVLAPELAALDWRGKQVFLAPASTILSNRREVWAEYDLARLLRLAGAEVLSLRLPDRNGRRRTLATAEGVEWKCVRPPGNAAQAKVRAEEAGRTADALKKYRLSLPRKRSSPAVELAGRFIAERGIVRLTTEAVGLARQAGISKDALWKALKKMSAA